MRCLTREAFEAARPLAYGWGVETAMTIDLLTAGYRVAEVPCDLQHRVTGADWRGRLPRVRQDPGGARRLAGPRRPAGPPVARAAPPRHPRWTPGVSAPAPATTSGGRRTAERAAIVTGAAAVVVLAATAALGESAAVPPVGPRTVTPPWDLALHPSPALVTGLLWLAAALGTAAVALGLRAV